MLKPVVRRLYLDYDGVMANFDDGFRHLFGRDPDRDNPTMDPAEMYAKIDEAQDFYLNLQLMPDAYTLFSKVEHLRPVFLTGIPYSVKNAAAQKMAHRDKHFPGVPMVTCFSRDKHKYCFPGDVLVDDWHKARAPWETAGGEFVHHVSAKDTLVGLTIAGWL